MPVYESRDSETLGELVYVRGDTVGLRGLTATLGATRVIVVQSDEFQQGKPLVFDTKCITTREPRGTWHCFAGIQDFQYSALRNARVSGTYIHMHGIAATSQTSRESIYGSL